MIDWRQYEADEAAEKARRDGYRAADYTGTACENCGRHRVMNCQNGRHVCEKCGWDADQHEYSDFLTRSF